MAVGGAVPDYVVFRTEAIWSLEEVVSQLWGSGRWLLGMVVVSILVLGLAAQNAPAAPLDVTCTPRPPVTVSTAAVLGTPGSLQATISATGVGNTLTALRFDDPRPS